MISYLQGFLMFCAASLKVNIMEGWDCGGGVNSGACGGWFDRRACGGGVERGAFVGCKKCRMWL